jgi:NOL1/NOP2/sun family putative RNA methylase
VKRQNYETSQKLKEYVMKNQKLPAEFVTRMEALLGEEQEAFLESYETEPYKGLRWNVLKADLTEKEQEQILKKIGVSAPEPVPWAENGWYYEEEAKPGRHPYHDMGLYYIQEPSAMSAAALLHPEPGERVLDLCAAPGGKSTQLASYMRKQGLLIANEINPARCRILSQNIERMGIANAMVTNEDSGSLAKRFPEYFHRIQVDAPCSGEGMFRKNPEAVEEWSLDHVKLCADRQLEILENAAAMLMPGGEMVYSTCTFAPEENEALIAGFLTAHPDFTLVEKTVPAFDPARPEWAGQDPAGLHLERGFRLWPHHLHGEGHFAAILKKEGSKVEKTKGKKEKPGKKRREETGNTAGLSASDRETVEAFFKDTLTEEMSRWILSGSWILFGEQLYRLPEGAPNPEGLRVLRPGLHLGTLKKNRFEPSHALALYLSRKDALQVVNLLSTEERTSAYFKGETIPIVNQRQQDNWEEGTETHLQEKLPEKGWCLICVDGYSAGWGKAADGQIKNHYPKGLRKY